MELTRRKEKVRMLCATLNTRAPAPVDVTKGKRMGKSENKKKSNSGWVGVFRMRVA